MNMVRKTSVRSTGKGQWFRTGRLIATAGVALALGSATFAQADENEGVTPILPLTVTATTVATNGDANPYGVAFVPPHFAAGGVLNPGDLLVTNYDSKVPHAGMGTTIVRIQPNGQQSTFFTGTDVGLTAGLWALRAGFVLVANLPTLDGTTATVQKGSLLVIDKNGSLVTSIADPNLLNGPWELTVHDMGNRALVFVANVLDGTVTRFELDVANNVVTTKSLTRIASGYVHKLDPAVLVIGPSGLAFDPHQDALYVASTGDNMIFRVANAARATTDLGTGTIAFADQSHLHAPLGLVLGPNGHLFVANSDGVVTTTDAKQPSEIVELTLAGQFIAQQPVDPILGGAFSLDFDRSNVAGVVRFAAIDDVNNTATIWMVPTRSVSFGEGAEGFFSRFGDHPSSD
jgi:DNA-binding beta-propeller fold protein YncE